MKGRSCQGIKETVHMYMSPADTTLNSFCSNSILDVWFQLIGIRLNFLNVPGLNYRVFLSRCRYDELAESVEDYVLDVLRDQLNRRQPMDNVSRNLLRLLTATCGYKEARLMAVQRLEMWLQNPKVDVKCLRMLSQLDRFALRPPLLSNLGSVVFIPHQK